MSRGKIKKKILQYTALFSPDEEGGFVVEVPALPGCVSQGETVKEAKENIQEAIELYIETLKERGLEIPEDEEPNFFKLKVDIPYQFA